MSIPFSEFVEVPEGSPQVIIDPKSPFAILPTTEKDCPCALGRNFKTMLLVTFGIPNRGCFDMLTSRRSEVGIMTLEQDG